MQSDAVWQILTFLLNSILFVLIGLQLPTIRDDLGDVALDEVVVYAAIVTGVVIGTRIVWTYVFQYAPYFFRSGVNWRLKIRTIGIVAWMGMRGAVSLAAALALPTVTDAGEPFTERPVILACVFGVILGTLVLQGLSLPWLIRLLRIEADDGDALEQESRARLQTAQAALDRLDDLEQEDWTRDDTVERMRGLYRYRRERFAARFDDDVDDGAIEDRSTLYGRMVFSIIDAQREALDAMRRAGEISDDVMRTIQRDLDLEERRMEEVRR